MPTSPPPQGVLTWSSNAAEMVASTSGIHVRLLIMDFRGVGTRKGAPDLGECGLL